MTENKRVVITRQYIATIISQKIPVKLSGEKNNV